MASLLTYMTIQMYLIRTNLCAYFLHKTTENLRMEIHYYHVCKWCAGKLVSSDTKKSLWDGILKHDCIL